MLVLVFHVGDEQFALDYRHIVEIVPAITLQSIPHTRAYLPGLLRYRGESVPVVDLCAVALGRRARPQLSTRIVVVRASDGGLIGLLAERVVECRNPDSSPGAVAWRSVQVDDLLPSELKDFLGAAPDVATGDLAR